MTPIETEAVQMDFWTMDWPELERNLTGWMIKYVGFINEADRAAVLAGVKVALLKLQKRKPHKTADELRAYGWKAGMNCIKQRQRDIMALKSRMTLSLEDGLDLRALESSGLVGSRDGTPLDVPERYLCFAAAIQYAIARAKGAIPVQVIAYAGKGSDITPDTPKAIQKKAAYLTAAFRTAPQTRHYRSAALRELERLLAAGMKSAGVEYGDAEEEDLDLRDEDAMEMGTLEEDGEVTGVTALSTTARDCAALLHHLMPRMPLSEAMNHAVAVEREMYGGPNDDPNKLLYCVVTARQVDGDLQRLSDIHKDLEALWREGTGDIFLMMTEGDVPAIYVGLQDGCASFGLPCADLLPDDVNLCPPGEDLLDRSGFIPPEPGAPSFYCKDQHVDSLDEMTDLFSTTCEVAREAYGFDPLEFEELEVEVESLEV